MTLASWTLWGHAAGMEHGFDLHVDLGAGLGGGAVGTFLTTLVIGAILVAVVPEYAEGKMAAVLSEPIDCFLYGVVALVGLAFAIFLLAISVLGLLLVIPLVIGATLVWSVGAAIAFLAVADRLLEDREGWLQPLLLAAGLNGGLALTGIGAVVGVVVGAAGFGAVLRGRLGG